MNTLNSLELFLKHHPNAKIIIGGDFNGWHTQWGSVKNNKRGVEVISLTIANDLFISNVGNIPNLRNGHSRSRQNVHYRYYVALGKYR